MTRSPPRDPLIAIIGATGTGKSQLAVELAKRYNGEVINGDAMQLYAGLPIITNKITVEEQQGIPHHLLGHIGLREQTWVVGTFVKKALGVIEEIRSRGKVPILVGGTHYYLQSLLFKDRLAESEEDGKPFVKDMQDEWPILRENTVILLEELKRVDPVMAERWHPKDRRKIQRSLEIYLQTGKKASDIYAAQRENTNYETSEENGSLHDEPLMRFPTLLLWTHAESEALNVRLEKRVDKMLEAGLLEEVHALDDFLTSELEAGRDVDETRGIWISIGYKEFKAYMQALRHGCSSDVKLSKLKAEGLERTKIATRQYAKRQVKWIRIKLVNALQQGNAGDNLYLLDGSDVSVFDSDVVDSASTLAHDFLAARSPLADPKSMSTAAAEMLTPKRDYDLSAQPEKWQKTYCDLCDITCMTEDQWLAHAKSRAHRRLIAKRKKAEHEGSRSDAPG